MSQLHSHLLVAFSVQLMSKSISKFLLWYKDFLCCFSAMLLEIENSYHILLNVCSIVCIEYLIAILPILLLLIGHLSNVILWITALFSHLFIFPRLNRQLRSVLCLMCLSAKMKNNGFSVVFCFKYGSLKSRNSKFIKERHINISMWKYSNRILTEEQWKHKRRRLMTSLWEALGSSYNPECSSERLSF